MTEFTPCEKRTAVDVPPDAMVIVLRPEGAAGDGMEFSLQTYHNFQRESANFTDTDKCLWYVCQGVLDMAAKDGNKLMHRGFTALKSYFERNGLDISNTNMDAGLSIEQVQSQGNA